MGFITDVYTFLESILALNLVILKSIQIKRKLAASLK